MKQCPHCSAPLPDTAIKCKHCRKRFDEPMTLMDALKPKFEDLKYQTFWRRVGAAFVDGLILMPIFLIKRLMLSFELVALIGASTILCEAIVIAYSVWMHTSYGQTVGKMVFKVKIIDVPGGKLSLKQAAMRDIFLIVSFLILCLFILLNSEEYAKIVIAELHHESIHIPIWYISFVSSGIIWMLLELVTMMANKKRRAVHDYLAGSIVVKSELI